MHTQSLALVSTVGLGRWRPRLSTRLVATCSAVWPCWSRISRDFADRWRRGARMASEVSA